MLAAALAGLLGLVSLDRLPRPLSRLRVIAPFAELSREGRRLFMHPGRCGAVLGLSVFTIGLTIVAFKLIADSIGSRLSLGIWTMVVPPVTLIQLLPMSLAGWGFGKPRWSSPSGHVGFPKVRCKQQRCTECEADPARQNAMNGRFRRTPA